MKVEEPVSDKAEDVEIQEEKESQNVSAETLPELKIEPEEEQSKDTSEHHNMETEPVSDLSIFLFNTNSMFVIPFGGLHAILK